MTDHDRNMRTLIVCFVLAMGVLVPLRFLAVGQIANQDVKVLGETEEVVEEDTDEEPDMNQSNVVEVNDIVLPDVGGLN